jgi:hypothetical protein
MLATIWRYDSVSIRKKGCKDASAIIPPAACEVEITLSKRAVNPQYLRQNSAISSTIGAELGINPDPYRESYRSA